MSWSPTRLRLIIVGYDSALPGAIIGQTLNLSGFNLENGAIFLGR
jgi:hypothetical protein